MKDPLVSVIIPTYNRSILLERTILSVLNQTFSNYELIIIDDASKDNTEEMVKNFDDSRIHYIKHQKNKERSEARNTGITFAKGKYLAFLDDDDEWLPDKLEKQIKKFEAVPEDVGIIYCGISYCIKNRHNIDIIPKLRGLLFTKLLKENFICCSSPLIKKECFIELGNFDSKFNSAEDWDMWLRISQFYKIDFIPDVLVNYNLHEQQFSSDLNGTIKGLENILKKYNGILLKYPVIFNFHLIRLGIFYCIVGNEDQSKKYFRRSIKVKPFQINGYFQLFLSKYFPKLHRLLILFLVKRFTLTGRFLEL